MLIRLKHLLTPQHTNNHRPRLLHPTGLAILVGIALVGQIWIALGGRLSSRSGYVLGYATSIVSSQVIEQTNQKRIENGLSQLQVSQELSEAASSKAAHMFAHNYWAHIAPDGTTPWVFIKNAGYDYTVAGENLARDFIDTPSMIKAWMDSPTHRENILNPKYQEIGIAVVNGNLEGEETTLVVQMFGSSISPAIAQVDSLGGASTKTQINQVEIEGNSFDNDMLIEGKVPSQKKFLIPEVLGETGGLRINPLIVRKSFSLAILSLLFGVLVYDAYVLSQRKIPRRVGKNWAHLAFLSLIILTILSTVPGVIE